MEESYEHYLDVKPPQLMCPKHQSEKVVGILDESLELFCTNDLMEISQKKLSFCSVEQLLTALTQSILQNHKSINFSAQMLEVCRRQEKIVNTFLDFAKQQVQDSEQTKSDIITPESKIILEQVREAIQQADFKKVRILLKRSEDLQEINSQQAKRDRDIRTLFDLIRQRASDEERWGIIFAGLDYLNTKVSSPATPAPAKVEKPLGWAFCNSKLDSAVTFGYELTQENQVATRIEGVSMTCIASEPIPLNRRAVITFYVKKYTSGTDMSVGFVTGVQSEGLASAAQKIIFGPSGAICNAQNIFNGDMLEQGDVIEFNIIQREDNQAKVFIYKNLDQKCIVNFTQFSGRLIPAVSMAQIGDSCQIS